MAGGVLAAVLIWAVPAIGEWLTWSAGQRIAQLLVWVVAGIIAYFVALRLTGLRLWSLWRQEQR